MKVSRVDEIFVGLAKFDEYCGESDCDACEDVVAQAKSSLLSHILAEMPKELTDTIGAPLTSWSQLEGYNRAIEEVIKKMKEIFDADPR